MVDHGIEHQPEILTKRRHIFPCSEVWVHRVVVNHGESVIGRIRVKWKNVNSRDRVLHPLIEKLVQRSQRRLALSLEHIAVSDEKNVTFTEAFAILKRRQSRIIKQRHDAVQRRLRGVSIVKTMQKQ